MRSVLKKKSFNKVLAVIMCFAMLMVSAFTTITTASAKSYPSLRYSNVVLDDKGEDLGTVQLYLPVTYANEVVDAGNLTFSDDGGGCITVSTNAVFDSSKVDFYWTISASNHPYEILDGYSLNDTTFKMKIGGNSGTCYYSITAHYDEKIIETPTVPSSDNKTANVKYSVEPTYTVSIPATVTLGSTSTISSEDVVVEKGKQVEVTLTGTSEDDNSFKLKSAEGAEIEYTIENNGSAVSLNDKVLIVNPDSSSTGDSTLSFVAPSGVTYAGSYTGTVTFNVAVASV